MPKFCDGALLKSVCVVALLQKITGNCIFV